MNKWLLPISFAILLNNSVVWAAPIETTDGGKRTLIDFQLFQLPIEANHNSKAISEKKEKGEEKHGGKEEKMLDKKVDDAIKRALEEK